MAKRRITIVTGANSGIGFGICQRLLFQLCHANPSDALPQKFSLRNFSKDIDNDSSAEYEGLILIMACRNAKRAEAAKDKLFRLLDTYIEGLKKNVNEYVHAKKFREVVEIKVHHLDLSAMNSVFKFAEEISQQYPYITDLVCNAGLASFLWIDWFSCIVQLIREPLAALTTPCYYVQSQGDVSADGLGWVWQCNMFGHYSLYKSFEPLFEASPCGGRVIWASSLEASPAYYKSEDWQLMNTKHSYETAKYQIDLVATHLDLRARRTLEQEPTSHPTRHFIAEPGICATKVSKNLTNPVTLIIQVCLLYLARFFGSVHHPIIPYKAAVVSVHLMLAPLWFFALTSQPVRYGAETDRRGRERVGLSPVRQWSENCAKGEALLKNCDILYERMREREKGMMDTDA